MTADLLEARPGRIFVGRLATGSDLVEEQLLKHPAVDYPGAR